MPVISFISPKGGVGKTTAATILTTQLARKAKVIVIDADPNRPVAAWAQLQGCPANIRVISDANQENILDKIEQAASEAPFVVVDCEGTASLTVAYAIGASDLVVVPTQGSQLDAKQAAKALSLIKNTERQSRRPIPQRRYRTGRNRQLNLKVTDDVMRRFYALADSQDLILGEAFEQAVTALEILVKRDEAPPRPKRLRWE